jgi:hypothetical protein
MSYERGNAAIHLEMPDHIPHTEYVSNPKLIAAVTGLPEGDPNSAAAFYKAWNFDFMWRTEDPPFPHDPPDSWMGSARYGEEQELRPAVYPFDNEEEVLSFDPLEKIGRPDRAAVRKLMEDCVAEARGEYDVVVPTGYYNTVFTWCIKSFGWDLFMTSAMDDPERFDKVLEGFTQVSQPIFEAGADSDVDVFLCHDDIVWTAGAVFAPEWYREYIFPRYKKLWAPLIEAGKRIMFCSDGNFTEFVDDLVDCGANGFIFEPMTDLEYVAERYGQTHVIIGNADCRILTFGTRDEIRAEVERCTRIGKPLPGYFYAVGNHIPFNVPVENALLYYELIDEMGKR